MKMAAKLNFGMFIRNTKNFTSPVVSISPHLNKTAIRNGVCTYTFCPSASKDNLPSTAAFGSHDILLSNFRCAMDTQDVLEAVKQHYSIMNDRHILQAMRSIFLLQKSQSGRMSNGEVVNSPEFQTLANALKSKIRHLEVNELLDTLKYLGYIGVPATSKIMQTVLKLLSKHINELNLQQITFLDFLMKDFKNTPLVSALNIALPIVFEAHLMTECDFKNVNQLAELLIFVSKRPVPEKCCRTIIDALTEQRQNIDLKQAKAIFRSLCDLKTNNEKDELLLQHSLDIISDSIQNLSYYEMELILTRLLAKYSQGYDHFYHEEFLNACGKFIIDKNCNLEQGLWIIRKLCKFNHINLPLLDYLTELISNEPWLLEQAPAGMLISFLSGLSQADYKPQKWDIIKELVTKCAEMHQDRQELPWLKLVLDLCVMDCWSRSLFEKVFDVKFLDKHLSREFNTLDKLQLLSLHQCITTVNPWPDSPSVPPKYLHSAIEINGTHISAFPLLPALARGLGDHSYILTGVYTKLGHFLDYVVVMRKGGYPVAINLSSSNQFASDSQRKYVESLDLPLDSKIVAVLLVPRTMTSINNERVRGTFRLQINTIEALGISVAPILQSVWENIMESEKIPYLMQAIRQKIEIIQPTPVIVPV